jgi:hypothetical protein
LKPYALFFLATLAVRAAAADDPLVFSFFRNNGEDGLYLATSDDGLVWRPLNADRPLLRPEVGESKLMRDPSIARGPDGVFHMVWTTSWRGTTLGYSSSMDLRRWSPQRTIAVTLQGEVINCWAPELFFDERRGEYLVVWASTIRGRFPETAGNGNGSYNHRLYVIRTKDFQTFTKPALFYDPGFPVIDGVVFRAGGGRYAMVAKNEALKPEAKYLFLAFAGSPSGPWSKAGPPISGKEWAEGPTPVQAGGYWYIYFDKYRDHRYGVIRSRDLKTWEDLSSRLLLPKGIRHGTVFRAPRAVVAALDAPVTHPAIENSVSEISEERIAATLKKLASFGTRNTNRPGATEAARWIHDEIASYSPRLQVRLDTWHVKKKSRLMQDTDVTNVVAVLPGKSQANRHIIVSGHYDSLSVVRQKGGSDETEQTDDVATAMAPHAPGVSDDASGVAAVMELARTLSRHEFEKTLVFVAFAGEEQGLIGSTLYANRAKQAGETIEAMFNNDIIGNDRAGNGFSAPNTVRLFSGDPMDSPSRSLARYVHAAAARYVPSMKVDLVFREDRFARGGDHLPFHSEGYAAVRFTTAAEALERQHTPDDTFEAASPAYTARVAKVNAAAMASLGLAPAPPDVTRTVASPNAARPADPGPNLARGTSRYDAVLKWHAEKTEANRTGFAVVIRSTRAPMWEREVYAGDTREFTIKDLSIDDAVLGVKAVGPNGLESLVSAYVMTPFRLLHWDAEEAGTR